MTDEEIKEFNSAVRMTEVMTANNAVFSANANAMSLKAALETDIGVLGSEGAARVSASGLRTDATADRRVTREALEDYLRDIAENGRTIKKAEPDFDNVFKLPGGSLSSQELIDAANAFKKDMDAAAKAKFAAYGFSVTDIKFQQRIDAFEAARAQQSAGKSGGVAATAETKAAITRLKANRRTLKQVGENITEENGDAGLIAEWQSACKLPKPGDPAPPTPPTPPTP
jgi:hypothetical protein